MASKKYSFLTGVLCLLASYGFSQTTPDGGYRADDSSLIPSRRMPQHTEFMNGTYNYPAKPRSQWELGIKAGSFSISGDVPSQFLSPGFGVHIRKAFGYLFSARLEYMYGSAKGLSYLARSNYHYNTAWRTAGYDPNVDGNIYPNYKSKVQDLALEGVFTLNNIRFHKAKTGFALYGLAGIGATWYNVSVNALNGTAKINFAGLPPNTYENRKSIKDELKDRMDDSYETDAENHGDRRPDLFGGSYKTVGHFGAGVAFKLNNKINLALEDRFTFTNDDLIDGWRWAEQVPGSPVLTQNFDTYNFLSLGLNINLGKGTEPLWWLNPLDYAYSEIRNPRLMRLPKPVLPDTDGDGVTDQFDQEQTPAGCPVDTHGVSRDTDGDGVPDCRDKQLVTPTYCQPVDADGVGTCPDPECCKNPPVPECAAALGALPSITFSGNSATLSNDAKSMLTSVAARLRNAPECKIVVTGYCASSKPEQQRSWDRVNAVINFMVENQGVSADRFFFNYGQEGGDCNTVDLRAAAADEQGQTTVPAPHPNLRKN
jgi:outer membrane protein OmpA-like peptidoglycan-associated protein